MTTNTPDDEMMTCHSESGKYFNPETTPVEVEAGEAEDLQATVRNMRTWLYLVL